MPTNICVLKTGGDFTPDHVRLLATQIDNLVCLSDVLVEGVPTILLNHDWPAWWAKMEMFRPDIHGDIFFIDLDTVITGDISDLINIGKTTMLKDFYHNRLASGLMYITESDRRKVWDAWYYEPEYHMARCGRYGDQMIIGEILHDAATWQNELPNRVISYKADYLKDKSKLEKAAIVCFHGKPRPWDVAHDWLPKYAHCR